MNRVLWNVIEAANVILEMLVVLLYFNRLFEQKYEQKYIYKLSYLLATVVLYATGLLTSNSTILISVTFAILVLLSALLYEGTMLRKIFLSLLFIVIVFISEILFIGLMVAFNIGLPGEIVAQGIKRIIGMIGTKIIYFWMVVIICRIINKKIREVPLKQWVMIFLMPVISTVILYMLFYSLMDSSSTDGIVLYFVAVLGLLYINFAVFDFFETYSKQLRLSVLEKVIEHETENYRQIEHVYNDMRKLKHDINNQINVINVLVMQNDKKSAEKVLKNMSNQLESAGAICYTGEPIIDSVINIKLSRANKLGIRITKRIMVSDIKLDKIELCRILGNALDNAIEGCERSGLEVKRLKLRYKDKYGSLHPK